MGSYVGSAGKKILPYKHTPKLLFTVIFLYLYEHVTNRIGCSIMTENLIMKEKKTNSTICRGNSIKSNYLIYTTSCACDQHLRS